MRQFVADLLGESAADLRSRVTDAMTTLRAAAALNTGTYVNECDYFQPDRQKAFWGTNYPRFLQVKRRYDPSGLFTVHHGVGREAWSEHGSTPFR
jgi:hypothetical protein